MSRCFPFPPPGYEKKARLDETNLLTKEKPKEKKHRDKKDKEKSERKAKKNKESSEENKKEREDRKENRRDKKDKDRDKEKKRISDKKKIVGPPDSYNGGKLDTICLQNGETKDSKVLLELGKRIRDEGGARENGMVRTSAITDQRKVELPRKEAENNFGNVAEGKEKCKREDDKERKRTSDEKKIVGPPVSYNGGKLGTICLQNGETKDSKLLLELGKRIRDEGGARENDMVRTHAIRDQRKVELPRKEVENNFRNVAEGNEKGKRENDKKANEQADKVEARGMESAAIQYFTTMDQERVAGVLIPVDKDVKKRSEGKKRNKHKDHDSRGDRKKDKEREKKKNSKDKEREKKVKAKENESNKENPKLRESCEDSLEMCNIKPPYLLKEKDKSPTSDGTLGKRKEQTRNGFLHGKFFPLLGSEVTAAPIQPADSETRPNKLSKPLPPSPQVLELGRKMEPCQTTLQFSSERAGGANNLKVESKVSHSQPALENGRKLELHQLAINYALQRQGVANNHKKDNKETRPNGLIEAQQANDCSTSPLFVSVQPKTRVEVSERPPHHKVDVKVSSSHSVLENGRKLELQQLAIQSLSEMQGAVNSHKNENKERKINGLIEVQQPNGCSTRPLSAPVQPKAKVKASTKPPHPDSKYLSAILSVPKIEPWSDFDDQEWLFCSDDHWIKKPKLDFSMVDGTPEVWAEALSLESADVTALPYVIPY